MAYIPPTPADVIARFPEFTGKEALLTLAIADGQLLYVDTSWPEPLYKLALIYAAAHLVQMGEVSAEAAAEGGQGIASESFGGISVSYKSVEVKGGALAQDLRSSPYGIQLWSLAKRLFGGPVVV